MVRRIREDLLHHERREAEGRLVEQQEPRPQHQRARDRQHLLLAARQRAGLLPPPLLEAREIAVRRASKSARRRRGRGAYRRRAADFPRP